MGITHTGLGGSRPLQLYLNLDETILVVQAFGLRDTAVMLLISPEGGPERSVAVALVGDTGTLDLSAFTDLLDYPRLAVTGYNLPSNAVIYVQS